jgi:hypothetical protein
MELRAVLCTFVMAAALCWIGAPRPHTDRSSAHRLLPRTQTAHPHIDCSPAHTLLIHAETDHPHTDCSPAHRPLNRTHTLLTRTQTSKLTCTQAAHPHIDCLSAHRLLTRTHTSKLACPYNGDRFTPTTCCRMV